jgi:transcription termination factor NusB
MAGQRRKARIIALKALYEMDTVAHQPEDILARLLEEAGAPPDVEAFARELVTSVLAHQEEIDEVIRQKAPAWPLEQGP